jgi:hypothetical protein
MDHACPFWILDEFSGQYITDTGGYFIVAGQDHGFFLQELSNNLFGSNEYIFEDSFLDPNNIWGLTQSLDWLARTAKLVDGMPSSLVPQQQISVLPSFNSMDAASSTKKNVSTPTNPPSMEPSPSGERSSSATSSPTSSYLRTRHYTI